ncbi:MAG TPA: hypothetical protein VEK15_14675 [Vicinamibacteria bacterium]|nr:hypothetical protein [Vicinamibacteria bacterium]
MPSNSIISACSGLMYFGVPTHWPGQCGNMSTPFQEREHPPELCIPGLRARRTAAITGRFPTRFCPRGSPGHFIE